MRSCDQTAESTKHADQLPKMRYAVSLVGERLACIAKKGVTEVAVTVPVYTDDGRIRPLQYGRTIA